MHNEIINRLSAAPIGVCNVDMLLSFTKVTHSQSCGKCVPCRVGVTQLENLLTRVLDGNATENTLKEIENLAKTISSHPTVQSAHMRAVWFCVALTPSRRTLNHT